MTDITKAAQAAQPVAFGDEVINYINRYGGNCRDCADENGVCPSRGLPCADSKKAIRFVLEALAYGLNNGYLKPATAQPQQAPETCQQVNSGVRCGVPRKSGERLCPDCNPQQYKQPDGLSDDLK